MIYYHNVDFVAHNPELKVNMLTSIQWQWAVPVWTFMTPPPWLSLTFWVSVFLALTLPSPNSFLSSSLLPELSPSVCLSSSPLCFSTLHDHPLIPLILPQSPNISMLSVLSICPSSIVSHLSLLLSLLYLLSSSYSPVPTRSPLLCCHSLFLISFFLLLILHLQSVSRFCLPGSLLSGFKQRLALPVQHTCMHACIHSHTHTNGGIELFCFLRGVAH